jgi:hypothetical protein
MPPKKEYVTEVRSDLDMLNKLMQGLAMLEQAERDLDDAKRARNDAKAYVEALGNHLRDYTNHRNVKVAEQLAMGAMFEEMPPWLSNAKNLDGRDDEPDDEPEQGEAKE